MDRKRAALVLLVSLVMTFQAVLAAEVPGLSEAIAAQQRLSDAVGAYRVEYEIASKQHEMHTPEMKLFDLKGTFGGLFTGEQYRFDLKEDTIWFPDEVSPAIAVPRTRSVIFDGEKNSVLEVDNEHAVIESGPQKDFILPESSWRKLRRKPLVEYLARPNVTALPAKEFAGAVCSGFEVQDSEAIPGHTRAFRFWFDPANRWYPMCIEVREVLPNDEFPLVESVETTRVGHTPTGIPYSLEWKVTATTTRDNSSERVPMLDRTYRATKFDANVVVPPDSFKMVFPDGTMVEDRISGTRYVVGELGARTAAELRAMLDHVRPTVEETPATPDTSLPANQSLAGQPVKTPPSAPPRDTPPRHIPRGVYLALSALGLLGLGAAGMRRRKL